VLLSIKGSDFCASGHRQRWFTFNNQARMFIGGERKVKVFFYIHVFIKSNLILYLFNEDCQQPMATSAFPPTWI
jgi:hypothetical protein